jgi:hypothetical protein
MQCQYPTLIFSMRGPRIAHLMWYNTGPIQCDTGACIASVTPLFERPATLIYYTRILTTNLLYCCSKNWWLRKLYHYKKDWITFWKCTVTCNVTSHFQNVIELLVLKIQLNFENVGWHHMWHAMWPHIFKMWSNSFCSVCSSILSSLDQRGFRGRVGQNFKWKEICAVYSRLESDNGKMCKTCEIFLYVLYVSMSEAQ